MASCATSSESARLLSSQRARLKAASRCGSTSCSKRARSCASNTSEPFPWSYPLMGRNRLKEHFIPSSLLDVTNKQNGWGAAPPGITGGPGWSAQIETRPICGAGPLDSLARAALPRKLKKRPQSSPDGPDACCPFSSSGTPNSPRQDSKVVLCARRKACGAPAVLPYLRVSTSCWRPVQILAEKFRIKRYKFWKGTVFFVGGWFFSLERSPRPVVR